MFSDTSTKILYQAVSEHLHCELNGEAVILSLKNGKYYGLNQIGANIWELLQKPISLSRLEKKILADYDVDARKCSREVASFLTLMQEEGLIEIINVPVAQIRQAAGGGKDTIY